MSTDYEPTKEQVEALAKLTWSAPGVWAREPWERVPEWQRESQRAEARFVLRRQHERERGLLEALRAIAAPRTCTAAPCICKCCRAYKALAAHAALDAPKVPTLLEAARNAIEDCGDPDGRAFHGMVVSVGAWLALKDAVERSEKDAPKKTLTVLDAAKACVRASCGKGGNELDALRALKAAVEREERGA